LPHKTETSIVDRSKLESIKIGSEEKGPTLLKRGKSMRYVSLHHHSTYSWLDGYGQPSDHVRRAAELGMSAMALTEHGHISSHPKLELSGQDFGVKPIFGAELYCGGAEPTQKKNHLTVLAESEEGYRNLMRIVSWAWVKVEDGGGFYYEPTVQGRVLHAHRDGLVVLSGCNGSLLATSLVGGKLIEPEDASFERGLEVARRFKESFGDSYYLEVQAFPDLESTCRINVALERIARRLSIPLVATGDVHYTKPEENELQKILHAIRSGKQTVEEQARNWGYDVLLCHPQSDREMITRLEGTGLSPRAAREALAFTGEIAERCTVVLPKAAPLHFPTPGGIPANDYWKEELRTGWAYRGIGSKKDRDRYAKQMAYEVGIIEGKDYVDYFLIVGDMVRWAKDNGIFVGPARGSAAASLVCYLLRITEVDPLLFPDLVFERFIDVSRTDLPDIDLDYDDRRRGEVYEYLTRKYGAAHVGQLGTFITFKSRNSLDDVARVYGIPKWEVDKVKEFLIERSSGDLRASATIEDTAETFTEVGKVFADNPDLWRATDLEGMVKGMSKHAAGVVVSSEPLTNTCAVYDGVISVDKYDAEHLNLLKIDNLGLATCGMLSEACSLLGHDITWLYDVPLDDQETIEGFRRNDVIGIFQFDGNAMRLVNGLLRPDSFYEVCVVNALARPGPLHNGAMADYTDIKHGAREREAFHPIFDRIVENTQGQVVYQEQILRIVREIGDFDWTHAAYIRKIISRKIGDQEFNRQWDRFWEGAKKNGFTEEQAKSVWGLCITSGSYAFNAAHSVSYGMLGFWSMWLKIHHPLVFYLAALRRLPAGDKGAKRLGIMRDAVQHGVPILAPDPGRSAATWEPEGENSIRAGFDQIPGIGPTMAPKVAEYCRENGSSVWSELIGVKGIGPKTIETIHGWVNQEDPLGVHILDKKLKEIKRLLDRGKLEGSNGRKLPAPTHRTSDIPYGRGSDIEVVWIGVVLDRNLRDLFEINMARTGEPLKPEEVDRPELREWVLMPCTDGDDVVTFRIDRYRYPQFRELVWNIKLGRDIVLIKGVKRGSLPSRLVMVKDMTVIE
jgi:DNA polymerase-3 subunit alpha